MTRRMVAAAAAMCVLAGPAVALTHAHVPAPAAVPTACSTEDAPGPCVWDAQTQGNHQGRSFRVDGNGDVYPLP